MSFFPLSLSATTNLAGFVSPEITLVDTSGGNTYANHITVHFDESNANSGWWRISAWKDDKDPYATEGQTDMTAGGVPGTSGQTSTIRIPAPFAASGITIYGDGGNRTVYITYGNDLEDNAAGLRLHGSAPK